MTNLTGKFDVLRADLDGHIASINAELALLRQQVQSQNAILSIVARDMAEAADCACVAAQHLGEIINLMTPTPPEPEYEICRDGSRTDSVNYSSGYMANTWIDTLGSHPEWHANLGEIAFSIPNAQLNQGGNIPGIVLAGPKWYRATLDVTEPLPVPTLQAELRRGNVVHNWNLTAEGTYTHEFFVGTGSAVVQLVVLQIIGDPAGYDGVWYTIEYCIGATGGA